MQKILLIMSVSIFFSACEKDFSVWKNYNEDKLKEYKLNLGKSTTETIDSCWVSPSGLLVEVYHRGFGQIPKLASVVYCTYSGYLVDNTRFEHHIYDQNSSSGFVVGTTIKGFQEILCQMPQGSRFKIYVPYELGYGKEGTKGNTFNVPPYSTLIFEIEINDVYQSVPA